jgi:multiple sugar transport system permease protein
VPVAWVQTVRLLPFGLALLWPVIHFLPRDLIESARVDGAGPFRELCRVVFPLAMRPWLRAVLVLAALSLSELAASKLVSTPGGQTYAEELFMQLHYGTSSTLAARSLLLLAVVAGLACLVAGTRPGARRWT